jgi:hypothetical protein
VVAVRPFYATAHTDGSVEIGLKKDWCRIFSDISGQYAFSGRQEGNHEH